MNKILIPLVLTIISSCAVPTTIYDKNINVNSIKQTRKNNIKGVVQFPQLTPNPSLKNRGGKDFDTKANFDDISKQSSVSIIYPADSVNANKTISSTVSDINGVFDLNLTKNPEDNEILILEASKRLGGVGNHLMSLRTFIKWTGTQWQSITTNGLYINNHTTAITLIKDNNLISYDDTLNKVSVDTVNNTITTSDMGTSPNVVISQTINTVATLVENVLTQNYDPVYSIRYSDGLYYSDRNINATGYNIDTILQTGSCISCDLKTISLLNFKFDNVNLTGSDLSGLDLTNKVLINNNLTQVNLSSTNLSNKDLTTNTLNGVNLSKSNLENSILSGKVISNSTTPANLSESYLPGAKLIGSTVQNANLNYAFLMNSDLSNADFSNSDLKNADLSGANISGAIFTGADLSGAKWTDGNVCLANSIGQCNQ